MPAESKSDVAISKSPFFFEYMRPQIWNTKLAPQKDAGLKAALGSIRASAFAHTRQGNT